VEWQSLGDEKRGTEVDPAGSRPVNRVGRDLARGTGVSIKERGSWGSARGGRGSCFERGQDDNGVMH